MGCPTPTVLLSPTPTHLSSTPPLPDVRTKPVPWCLAPTVVLFPSESSLPQLHPPPLRSPPWRRPGRRGRPLLRLRLKLTPRRIPGCSTAPMAIGPMATATLLTATLPMPMLAIMDTMVLAITMATMVGRRGRRLLRLMPTLLLRPTHGCCMEATTVTDLPMEDITVTDTTMRHMTTLLVAVITSVVLSPALADKKERCQQKIKIDSWNHFFVS